MSSVLDTLTPEQYAEVVEAVHYRRMERALLDRGMWEIVSQDLVREVAVTAPGAGSEWLTTVPAGTTWEVLSIFAQLATSAVVGTRAPMVQLKDADGAIVARFAPGGTQAASLTGRFSWTQGVGATSGVGLDMGALPTPPLPLVAGWTIGSITSAFDTGDTYTQVMLLVREWTPARVVHVCASNLADLDSAGGIRYPGG